LLGFIVVPSSELIECGGGDVDAAALAAVFEPAARDAHPDRVRAAAKCDGSLGDGEPAPRMTGACRFVSAEFDADSFVDEVLKSVDDRGCK
jgi:hypothetical protein